MKVANAQNIMLLPSGYPNLSDLVQKEGFSFLCLFRGNTNSCGILHINSYYVGNMVVEMSFNIIRQTGQGICPISHLSYQLLKDVTHCIF